MAASPLFANLEKLVMHNNGLTTDSAISLSKSKTITRLQSLDLNNNDLRAEGAKAPG